MIAQWAAEADAVRFSAPNGGSCLIHRLAFRALLGRDPRVAECVDFVNLNIEAISAAAATRLSSAKIGRGINFHLNSRQIRRATIWQVTCMLEV